MTHSSKKPFYKRPILIGTLVGLPLVVSACAGMHHRGHHGHGFDKMAEKMVKRVTKKLDLNEVQQKELADVQTYIAQNKPDFKRGSTSRSALMDSIKGEQFDRAQFESNWSAMMTTHNEGIDERQQFMDGLRGEVADFLASLDSDQRQKLADKIEHFRSHHHGKGHRKGEY